MSEALISPYYDKNTIAHTVRNGDHRALIGGMWDEIGKLQCDFMIQQGLHPNHKLLDLGCGSLRGGVHFVPYLDSGNYFGFDMNSSLFEAGYEREIIPSGLAGRLPRSNLVAGDNFDFSKFTVQFNRVIALSVFTHLTLNMIRVCLERLAPNVVAGGEFYATYFNAPKEHPTHVPLHHTPEGVITHSYKDPYHYRFDDLMHAARDLPWEVSNIGNFNHPRDQHMALFRKRKRGWFRR